VYPWAKAVKHELAMRRSGSKLLPETAFDLEMLQHIPSDRAVIITVHAERNVQHHKKLWAVAARVADFCDAFDTAEEAVEWVKMQTPGMVKEYHFESGKMILATKSISFSSMGQDRFNVFFENAMRKWAAKIGCDPEMLE
jgi:hypothetical protein